MEEFMAVFGVVIIIVAIIVSLIKLLIAGEAYDIARMKGYDDMKYYWITFLLSEAGILLVIALPNKKESTNSNKNLLDELPEL